MKKIVMIMLLFSMLGFGANKNLEKFIGYWYYSKVGFQDPVGIRKLPNNTYQIGFSTWEGNADENGFEWEDLQPLKNGSFKVKGSNMYIGFDIKNNKLLYLDSKGIITSYLDKKISKLPY